MKKVNRIVLWTCLVFIGGWKPLIAGNNGGGAFSTWPDTGQTTCSDADNNVLDPCPSESEAFYGQDAQYQGQLHSYTVLGGGIMVQDNVTGLVWEVKEAKDGTADYNNPHDTDNTYTWCDTDPATNGGNQGTCGDNDTEDFIDDLNGSAFGGYADWRLPTLKELISIVDYGRTGPTIDTSVFPNSHWTGVGHWSSTTYSFYSDRAWMVGFFQGDDYWSSFKSSSFHVRAVRGGHTPNANRFVDNGDGTVTDTVSCLMWQQSSMDNNDDGTPDAMTWEEALSESENLILADHSDWRLPNIHELRSIVDYSLVDPAIDMSFFPDTPSSPLLPDYWSSTTQNGYIKAAWSVYFGAGKVSGRSKLESHYVHAVRGDNCNSLDTLQEAIAILQILNGQKPAIPVSATDEVSNDQRLGLEEVIYALQVVAGLKPDNDGDGYSENQGDCNDSDPDINPGAAEICGDDKDNNCNDEIDEGCSETVTTPAGQNVAITALGFDFVFDSVTGEGETTVEIQPTAPGPPVGFLFAGTYYDISTTAQFAGSVEICINYDDTGLGEEEEAGLQIFHYNGGTGQWENITTIPADTGINRVCGETTGFSPIGLGFSSILGNWRVYYVYYCTTGGATLIWKFNSDGSFIATPPSGPPYNGTWTSNGVSFTAITDVTYSGTISGNSISGSWVGSGYTHCFNGVRQ